MAVVVAAAWATQVASGHDLSAALTVAPVVHAVGGSLVLTRRGCVPLVVLSEVERLRPQRVVMIGGRQALGDLVREVRGCSERRPISAGAV